jgi:uroporphyrinogen decarboxylase
MRIVHHHLVLPDDSSKGLTMLSSQGTRRGFLKTSGWIPLALLAERAAWPLPKPQMSKLERVKAVLQGDRVDRLPFTFWHHFGLEKLPGEKHAEATLAFYRKYDLDLIKVMSDFPYPLPKSLEKLEAAEDWEKLEVLKNPFPEQIKALKLIHKDVRGQAPFVETIFQSWTVAEKLSSKSTVRKLKEQDPNLLKKVLRVISESQANHARLALEAGAAGVFLALAAADDLVMERQEYLKHVRESDLIILDAVKDKSYMNILHLHGNRVHFDSVANYPVQVINYSVHGTKTDLSVAKRQFSGTLMGGLDESRIANLTEEELKSQIQSATLAMQKRRLILAPGCSVPNDTPEESLQRVRELLQKA